MKLKEGYSIKLKKDNKIETSISKSLYYILIFQYHDYCNDTFDNLFIIRSYIIQFIMRCIII